MKFINKNKIYFFTIFVISLISLSSLVKIKAADSNPYAPPAGCASEDTTIDIGCQLKRIEDPTNDCQLVICKTSTETSSAPVTYTKLLTFFGSQSIYIKEGKDVVALINLGVTTFLGLVSVFAIVYGIYTAGVVRAKTTDPAQITQANKTLISLIIGFVLAWGFIFLMQVVLNLLGLGSLNELVLISDSTDSGNNNEIVIQ